jgi:ribose transport system substrate-binding protein
MKRLCVLLVLFSVGAAAACSRDAAGPRRLRLAIIPKALDIPVFNYAKVGAERAAAQLGNVDIVWRGPERADELRQKEIVESFITQRVDGIAISVLNADFLTGTIDRAVDAGIPVVTWDSDAPKSKRQAFYGVDDYKSGQILGDEAARLLDGKGTVAIITSLGAANLRRRLEGVQSALSKHPGLRVVETYDIQEDPVRCAEIIATGTNRYPDLGAWIAVGGWPVFTRNALAAVDPARTKVVSFDTIPPAPEILKAGKVQVLLGQKYFGWGSESVRLLTEIIAGRPPRTPIIDSGVDVVTAQNVDAYLEQWARLERGDK